MPGSEPRTDRIMGPLVALRPGETELIVNPGTIGERTIRIRRRMHQVNAPRPVTIVSYRPARQVDGVTAIPGMHVMDGVTSLTVDDADRFAATLRQVAAEARTARTERAIEAEVARVAEAADTSADLFASAGLCTLNAAGHLMETAFRGALVTVRRCSLCGWVDGADLDAQISAKVGIEAKAADRTVSWTRPGLDEQRATLDTFQRGHQVGRLAAIDAVREALGRLDGTTGSAVQLLTGFTAEEIDALGGMAPEPARPVTPVECPSRIAHESGVVVKCLLDLSRHGINGGMHLNLPANAAWYDDDDRVVADIDRTRPV
jgi:hypothetical protein